VAFALIWMHELLEPWALALITVALMVGPSLAVFAIVGPPDRTLPRATILGRAKELWGPLLRDVRKVLLSKSGLTGILLMLSPVGTVALTNSFTGMKTDYHTSAFAAGLINGIVGAALTAIGAAIGGWICDRQNRRAMYLLSGVLTAVVALAIASRAPTREVYIIGVSAYNLVTGFCFAAFTATVLETIGHGDAAAGTKYTLCTAAGNIAIAYVNFVDTRAYAHWDQSTQAMFTCDALLNICGAAILAIVFWRLGSFGASKHPPEQAPPTPA